VQFPTSFHLLQWDQAGAHIATQLQWPAKVMPVFQPPASPERGGVPSSACGRSLKLAGLNFASLEALQQWLFRQLETLESRAFPGQPKLPSLGSPDL